MIMRYISHEIRTPLNTVFMGLKYIEAGLVDGTMVVGEAVKSVHDVKAAANVALSVLNAMLMFDKVKQGLLVLELVDVNPYAMLQEVVLGFTIQVQSASSQCIFA